MACLTCGSDTTTREWLCSTACRDLAAEEMDRNRTRLGELRQRRAGPPCAEAHGLMVRNTQLQHALERSPQAVSV